eukprot:1018109-Rhodomonas_salina.1
MALLLLALVSSKISLLCGEVLRLLDGAPPQLSSRFISQQKDTQATQNVVDRGRFHPDTLWCTFFVIVLLLVQCIRQEGCTQNVVDEEPEGTRIPGGTRGTRLPNVVTEQCIRREGCTIFCNRCDSSSGL